jgi:DNA-binding response OmpR family regulator
MSEMRAIHCPACGVRYVVEAAALGDDLRLICGTCSTISAAAEFGAAPAPAGPPVDTGPRVVIGHAVPSASRAIATTLREAGFAPVCVASGAEVLQACDRALPAPAEAVVLDVGIGGVLAFEIIEQLRAHPDTKGVPVVLLASVFEKTRYKRRPNRLYGADGYLELHHVPDRLPMMLNALRDEREVPETWMQAPSDRAHAAPLRTGTPVAGEEQRRTIARRILSDLALYHGDELGRGVAAGAPFGELRAAVDGAREAYTSQTSADDEPLFDDELEAFENRLMYRTGQGDDG